MFNKKKNCDYLVTGSVIDVYCHLQHYSAISAGIKPSRGPVTQDYRNWTEPLHILKQ